MSNFCYTVPFVAGLRQRIKLNAGIFHRLSVKSSFFSDFHPLLCPLNMSDGSSMCDPDEAPKHRSYLWSCVIWVSNKTSDEWIVPQWQYLKLIQGVRRKAGSRKRWGGGRSEERWEGMLKEAPADSVKREREVWFLQCSAVTVRWLWVHVWMCACIQAPMMTALCVLSSANAMLSSPLGHQNTALAENQLQVRSLALTLSVSWPRWWECSHSARIPKRAGQRWREGGR